MAGPILPYSTLPVTAGRVFAGVYGTSEEGLGVMASPNGDAIWRLRWPPLPALPAGTLKLVIQSRANAAAGAAQIRPRWASVAMGEDPDAAALADEGTQTIEWGAGEAGAYKRAWP